MTVLPAPAMFAPGQLDAAIAHRLGVETMPHNIQRSRTRNGYSHFGWDASGAPYCIWRLGRGCWEARRREFPFNVRRAPTLRELGARLEAVSC